MYCDTLKQNSNYSVDRKGIRMTLMTSPVLHLTIYIYDDDDDDDDSQCSLDSYIGKGGSDYEVFHSMDSDESFPTNEDLDHLPTDAALFNSKPMLSRCLKHQIKQPYPLLINDMIRINSPIVTGEVMVRVVGLCPNDPQRMVVVNSRSNCDNITPTTPDTRISVIRHPPYCSNCVIGTYAFVQSGSESIVDANSGLMNSIYNDRRNKALGHAKLQKVFEAFPPSRQNNLHIIPPK